MPFSSKNQKKKQRPANATTNTVTHPAAGKARDLHHQRRFLAPVFWLQRIG